MSQPYQLIREMRAQALYLETLHASRAGLRETIVESGDDDGPSATVETWVRNLINCASSDLAALFAEAEEIGLMQILEDAALEIGVEEI